MKRRSFLSLLSAAPVAAPIAAKEAVSGMAVTSTQAGLSVGNVSCGPPQRDLAFDALSKSVLNFRVGMEAYIDPSPRIDSMKSWSKTFKYSESRKEFIRKQKLRNQLDEILYGDMSIAEKTLRLAALGVKV